MQDSKLFHFLRLLDKAALKRFADFAASPYFCKREGPPRLAALLERDFGKPEADWQEEAVFGELYPGRPFSQNQIRKLKSQTMALLLRFLAFEEFQAGEGQEELALIRQLNKLGEDHFFDRFWTKANEKVNLSHPDAFERRFHLYQEANVHHSLYHGRQASPHLKALLESMELGQLMRRLQLAAQVENLRQVATVDLPLATFADLAALEPAHIAALPSLGQLWHALFMCYHDPVEPSHYHRLSELLHAAGGEIPKAALEDLHNGAINYCIRMVNSGRVAYRMELLSAYQGLEAAGLLSGQQRQGALHVKNMVLLAARLGRLEYAQGLLDRCEKEGLVKLKLHELAYNRGVLAFYRAEYEQAALWFHKVSGDLEDVYAVLDARTYLLRIYYEMGNAVGMEALGHSTRVYLDRLRGISSERKENYYTFVRLYRRLCNLPPMDRKRVLNLREEVEESTQLPVRHWFLEKLDALLGQG